MSSLAEVRFTPEEYLAMERKANHKSEYFAGRIYAMSGASRAHNVITVNVSRELILQLKDRPCDTYAGDMRVKVSPTGLYTYPDIVVVCGDAHFDDEQKDTLLNPTIIVEALSASTEAYDRGDKFAHYDRLESLSDYLLISQNKCRVEHFVRQTDQKWLLSKVSDPAGILYIASIDCRLALSEVYRRVEFTNEETRTEAV